MKSAKTFRASLDSLAAVRQFVYGCLESHPVFQDDKDQIVLAVDEAATNVIKHALQQDSRKFFGVEIDPGEEKITIVLSDEGPPFDPSDIPEKPDVVKRIREKKRGGLGIYLMRNVMDEVLFTREKNINRTIMIKKCRAK